MGMRAANQHPTTRVWRRRTGCVFLCVAVLCATLAVGGTWLRQSDTTNTVGFGFTLHTLYLGGLNRFNVPAFERNVDELAAQHAQWVRVDLWGDVVAPTGTATSIHWASASLATYDQALSYVKHKGLKVYLCVHVPNYTKGFSEVDYLTVAYMFYQSVVTRYRAYVDMWQIANEPSWSNFRDPSQVVSQPYGAAYTQAYNRLLVLARQVIKSVAPRSSIVVNVSISPSIDERPFLTVIAPSVDVIGVDAYPGTRMDLLDNAVSQMKSIEQTYHKPIMVAETGLCSATYGATGQSTYIPLYLSRFQTVHPLAILIYQYQDTPSPAANACDTSYGVVDVAGATKASFAVVMQSLRRLSRPNIPLRATRQLQHSNRLMAGVSDRPRRQSTKRPPE